MRPRTSRHAYTPLELSRSPFHQSSAVRPSLRECCDSLSATCGLDHRLDVFRGSSLSRSFAPPRLLSSRPSGPPAPPALCTCPQDISLSPRPDNPRRWISAATDNKPYQRA